MTPINWRVYYEELELEDGLDVGLNLFRGFDLTCFMRKPARALGVADEGRYFAGVSDADIFYNGIA